MSDVPVDAVLKALWENINALAPPPDAVSNVIRCFPTF